MSGEGIDPASTCISKGDGNKTESVSWEFVLLGQDTWKKTRPQCMNLFFVGP